MFIQLIGISNALSSKTSTVTEEPQILKVRG